MSVNYNEVQKKIENVSDCLCECAKIIGKRDITKLPNLNNFEPGLDLNLESEALNKMADNMKKGIFKVIAMGEFKNGKSTLLNSLIGDRALPARALACTAIITIIIYGKRNGVVSVYYKDKTDPVEMAEDEFNEKFKLSDDDMDIIIATGSLDRFKDISHAVIERTYPLCQNGVQLVDSPGLGEAVSRTETTLRFVPQANAIIFMLIANKLFCKSEKEYIMENFADKHLNNVFFVINRINQVEPEEVPDIKEQVKKGLKSVFIDKNGVFNEELYNRRVFFVDAKGALEGKEKNDSPKLMDSGVPEFEMELENFLSTDERASAIFESSLVTLANVYKKSKQTIEEKKKANLIPLKKLEINKKKSEEILKQAENNINNVTKSFKATGSIITTKVYNSLASYIDVMEDRWEEDSKNIDVRLSPIDMGKLWYNKIKKNDEGVENILAPLSNAIREYIKSNISDWAKTIPTLIKPEADQLQQQLAEFDQNFAWDLKIAGEVFSEGESTSIFSGNKKGKATVGIITGVLGADLSLAFDGIAGEFSWSQLVGRIVLEQVVEILIFGLFTGGIGWLLWAIWQGIKIKWTGDKSSEKILSAMRDNLFKSLREQVRNNNNQIVSNLEKQFAIKSEKVTNQMQKLVDEQRSRQDKIIEDIQNKNIDVDYESNRMKAILNRMEALIGTVYTTLTNKKLDEKDIELLASRQGSN